MELAWSCAGVALELAWNCWAILLPQSTLYYKEGQAGRVARGARQGANEGPWWASFRPWGQGFSTKEARFGPGKAIFGTRKAGFGPRGRPMGKRMCTSGKLAGPDRGCPEKRKDVGLNWVGAWDRASRARINNSKAPVGD